MVAHRTRANVKAQRHSSGPALPLLRETSVERALIFATFASVRCSVLFGGKITLLAARNVLRVLAEARVVNLLRPSGLRQSVPIPKHLAVFPLLDLCYVLSSSAFCDPEKRKNSKAPRNPPKAMYGHRGVAGNNSACMKSPVAIVHARLSNNIPMLALL